MTTLTNLKCEYRGNPLGLDVIAPRLSWQLLSDRRGARQSAYQIRAAASVADLTASQNLLWDTGQVASAQSMQVTYAGAALHSGQRVYWQVQVWDEDNRPSDWSSTAYWEMGLLDQSDWQAEWITPDWDEDTTHSQPAPLLRRTFSLAGPIQLARVYVTSLGLYELHLNGQRVGDAQLAPGWTSYDNFLQYQTYDVTGLLAQGDNALGAMLGDGWYRGFIGFQGNRNNWGDRLALLLQLQVTYADGRTQVIASDRQWLATPGPIRMTDIYNGEIWDARLEPAGWDAPGCDTSSWMGVRTLDHGKQMLAAQTAPLITKQEELRPIAIIHTPAGETVFDFGQNMVGWVRLTTQAPAGTTITLRHAEVLDQQGNFYTTNLRAAQQVARYTFKGDGVESYEPHFTFMGFRYVAVDGFPGEPSLDNLIGVVVHSDIPATGSFECSNPLLNQLQHNIVWGQKGNFVDVPTDCPQRDERLGWTGDAQVFIRTACFNRDVATFFTKWLRDLAAEQRPNGAVPHVIPDPIGRKGGMSGFPAGGSSAWADAATICPWTIYLCYGDTRILERQYASMAAWVNYMREQAGEKYLWSSGFHFGDWLDYRGRGEMDATPITDRELIATAFFAYSTRLLCKAALALGKTEDAPQYTDLLAKIVASFIAEFVSENGRIGSNSQSSYVLALYFDLLPESLRQKAADRLAAEVRKYGYHLTTGFVGTPYLCHVLSRFGHTDVAYELLNQESYPSWLYPVKQGATTIWERWDGIKPDGSFQDAGMNSFNHYAYGAIGDWMYRVVAGLDAAEDEPGYQHILIQPQPGGGLTHVRAALQTMYGEVVSAWQWVGADLRLQVNVPPNAHATVRIPATNLAQVSESGQTLDAQQAHEEGGAVVIEVGAGQYEFVSAGLLPGMRPVRHIAGRLDIGASLRDLLANDRSRALVEKYMPAGMLQSPMLNWVINMPLDTTGGMGRPMLSPQQLQELQAELIALQ